MPINVDKLSSITYNKDVKGVVGAIAWQVNILIAISGLN